MSLPSKFETLGGYLDEEIKAINPKVGELPQISSPRKRGKDPNQTKKAVLIQILTRLATCFTSRDKLMSLILDAQNKFGMKYNRRSSGL